MSRGANDAEVGIGTVAVPDPDIHLLSLRLGILHSHGLTIARRDQFGLYLGPLLGCDRVIIGLRWRVFDREIATGL